VTADPGARVAAVLGPLREVADEIVVAVDSRVDSDRLGRYAEIADRLFRFEFAPPYERILGWIHAQCTGDWVLRLDGDEALSSAALERLPELIAARDVFQYWFQCRWLYPDSSHWLDQPPWGFDTHRLLRNDAATTWFPGLAHLHVAPVFPSRYLREGFYHCDYLLRSRTQRQAKVKYYVDMPVGMKMSGSDVDMPRYHLPEDFRGLNTVAVAPEDRAAIEAVLNPEGGEAPTPEGLVVPLARRAEIDAFWPGRTLEADAYRASIVPLDPPLRLAPREHRLVHVRLKNEGNETWPWAGPPTAKGPPAPRLGYWPSVDHHPLIRLTYRWLAPEGSPVVPEGYRTPLPSWLRPGDSMVVPMIAVAPEDPGHYVLEVDLVHEFVRSFDCPVPIDATVTAGV
jgi:hypothetical protein